MKSLRRQSTIQAGAVLQAVQEKGGESNSDHESSKNSFLTEISSESQRDSNDFEDVLNKIDSKQTDEVKKP